MEEVLLRCCSTLPSRHGPCSGKNRSIYGRTIVGAGRCSVSLRLSVVLQEVMPPSSGEARKSVTPVRCLMGGSGKDAPSALTSDGRYDLGCRALEMGVDDASVIEAGRESGSKTGTHLLEMENLQFLEETDEGVLSERILRLSRSNKVRSALEVFFSMEVAGIKPSPHACNSLLSCILRNASLDDAFRVFEVMRKKDIGTGHTYSLMLKEAARARGAGFALRMLDDMERDEMSYKSFDVIVYNTVISVCAKERMWNGAERMWRKLKENGFCGTKVTYSLLVSTFVQCGQTELALAAYSEMIDSGYEPGEDVMKAIIASCTREGKWEIALKVFGRMLETGVRPNITVFNSVINCLGKVGEVDHAFRIYCLLKSSGHSPDAYTWNALLNALYRCERYADCVWLFERISKLKMAELNVHLYQTALMSCQKLGLWDRSLQFLWQMEATEIEMSAAIYNIVINCCENARKPKIALEVYHHMIHEKIPPDTFTYLTLIRACIWGSLWTEVGYILEHVEPNVSLYNALIHGFCLRGKTALAQKLYGKMRSYGLKPDGKTRALMLQHIPAHSFRYHPRYVNAQEEHVRHS